jgi:hypothetical protein
MTSTVCGIEIFFISTLNGQPGISGVLEYFFFGSSAGFISALYSALPLL